MAQTRNSRRMCSLCTGLLAWFLAAGWVAESASAQQTTGTTRSRTQARARAAKPAEPAAPAAADDSDDDEKPPAARKKGARPQDEKNKNADATSDEKPNDKDPFAPPTGPVHKSAAEWQAQLNRMQYMVLRLKGTEEAFTGKYAHGKFRGIFICAGCNAELFDSRTKFESGTGWPSFYQPLNRNVVSMQQDFSGFEPRVEVNCAMCDGHLGHVFDDGPAPTGLRFCINSASLNLKPYPSDEKARTGTAQSEASESEPRPTARSGRASTTRNPRTGRGTRSSQSQSSGGEANPSERTK